MRRLLPLLLLALAAPAPAPVVLDADGDGYPDVAELHTREDREAFLAWFALIAESQAVAIDDRWDPAQRDCAGLLRFAYRGALARHDARWLQGAKGLSGRAPELVALHGPELPLLGTRLFRVGLGPFDARTIDRDFAPSATAERLLRGSARPLRPHELPRRGDLLLYRDVGRGLAHAMVFLGDGRVVYHTGPTAQDAGQVRLTTLAALSRHPDSAWIPDAANPAFAGYFRWRIVGGEDR
jgi:uncharacterized protein YfaT (DUF1175 family)